MGNSRGVAAAREAQAAQLKAARVVILNAIVAAGNEVERNGDVSQGGAIRNEGLKMARVWAIDPCEIEGILRP